MLPPIGHDPTWRAGFVEAHALDELATIDCGEGQQMLHAIARLIEQADLEPPLAVV